MGLAAGGTGGLRSPAEAPARELLTRGCRVALVTVRRGQAWGDRVPGVGLHRIRAGRFGAGVMGKVIAFAELTLGTIEAGPPPRPPAPAPPPRLRGAPPPPRPPRPGPRAPPPPPSATETQPAPPP